VTDSNINTSFEKSWARHQLALEQRKSTAANKLRTVFAYLKQHIPQLTQITVQYHGSGDSGQVENISFIGNKAIDDHPFIDAALPADVLALKPAPRWNSEKQCVEKPTRLNASPREVIDDAAWDVAYGEHPAFETNEGGYGKVLVFEDKDNPGQIIVKLEHNEVIETSNYYETENVL
jgi:hypothetical protein